MSSHDVTAKKKCVVNYEDAKCVWRLECPFCGWVFGFCLDLTGEILADNISFFVGGARRTPARFPKKESGRTYAYFPVRAKKCPRCRAECIRDCDLELWFTKRGVSGVDYEKIRETLDLYDPDGVSARTCSDRVFDLQFEEWGVDGMPCEYLFVKNETVMLSLVESANPERLYSD